MSQDATGTEELPYEYEFANGGVRVEEADDGHFLTVTHICVGCGEEIREFDAFPDTFDEHKESRPLHDSLECHNKATDEAGKEVDA